MPPPLIAPAPLIASPPVIAPPPQISMSNKNQKQKFYFFRSYVHVRGWGYQRVVDNLHL